MLKAVLFDLDGTLLDIDLEPFLRDYFGMLGPVLASLLMGDDRDPTSALQAVISGTQAMSTSHPGRTNKEVFDRRFLELTELDLNEPDVAREVARFYTESFPTLRGGMGPCDGAANALERAETLGLATALATNPIFPRAAIDERARWAGIDTGRFDLVTSYETASACKPDPDYFKEVARRLDVDPTECLMVGDDPVLDLAAGDVGMKTFHVGEPTGVADWHGTLDELADSLERIANLSH